MSARRGPTPKHQGRIASAWADHGHRDSSHPPAGPAGTAAGSLDPRLIAVVEKVVDRVLDERRQRDGGPRTRRERPEVRRLYDVPSAAGQLSVSPAKVWELIRGGRLRAVKVDGRTLIQAAELDRFAAKEVRPG
jgi:excisionase family DNA binding protein